VRQDQEIIGIVADGGVIDSLRQQGLSWSEVAALFIDNPEVKLSRAEADALVKGAFAFWVDRRARVLISTRVEIFARLSDLSAWVGFDSEANTIKGHSETGEQARARTAQGEGPSLMHIGEKRRTDWVGPFLRAQFLRRPRKTSKRRM